MKRCKPHSKCGSDSQVHYTSCRNLGLEGGGVGESLSRIVAKAGGPGRGPMHPIWVLFSPPWQHQGKDPVPRLPGAGAGPSAPSSPSP